MEKDEEEARRRRRRRKRTRNRRRRRRTSADIKSNNPHLTGGEQNFRFSVFFSDLVYLDFNFIVIVVPDG